MNKFIEIVSTYPISFFLFTGIIIAAISTIIEENKRRKNKKN
jgi:cell division protein FtsL